MALRRKRWVRWIVSWLPHRLTIAIRSLLRLEHLAIAKVRHRWHRSLQLRVVGTTLVISATMIAILGFFLTEQIDDGLLVNAETSARAQVLTALSTARSLPDLTSSRPAARARLQFMRKIAPAAPADQRHRQLQRASSAPSPNLAEQAGVPQWARRASTRDATLPPALLEEVQQEQTAASERQARRTSCSSRRPR